MTKKIFKASNTSITDQVQVMNAIAGGANQINDGLALIPAPLYPDNPALDPLIQNPEKINAVSGFTKIASLLSPFAFAIGWLNTWNTIKRYVKEENKNFEKTLDLGVNVLTTLGRTALLVLFFTGVVFAAPYVLGAVLGLGASYALFNIVKHGYRAYQSHKEGDKKARKQHLLEIPKQLLLGAINALGFVLNLVYFNVGSELTSAADKFNSAKASWDFAGMKEAFNMTELAGAEFGATKTILYSLCALVTLGTVGAFTVDAFKHNKETFEAIKHPVNTLKKFGTELKADLKEAWEFAKARPYFAPLLVIPAVFNIATFVVNTAAKVLSLALWPVQALGIGIKKAFQGIKKWFSKPEAAAVLPQEAASSMIEAKAEQANEVVENETTKVLKIKHAQLKNLIEKEETHLTAESAKNSSKKILAKLQCVRNFKQKLSEDVEHYDQTTSVTEIENAARKESSRYKQSFWKAEGGVEKIARLMHEFEDSMNTLKPSASAAA